MKKAGVRFFIILSIISQKANVLIIYARFNKKIGANISIDRSINAHAKMESKK